MKKINPDMTILDVVSACRETEEVFRRHGEESGVCLCCEALFDSLRDAAAAHRLDLNALTRDLRQVVATKDKTTP